MRDHLLKLFNYDPITGYLTWKIKPSHSRVIVGSRAGYVDPEGYRILCLNYKGSKRTYGAHRLIWLMETGNWPVCQIDHRNGNKDDNWWSNLREATSSINSKNRCKASNNTSGTTGVCFAAREQQWMVTINHKYIGLFDTKEEAILVRQQAEANDGEYTVRHGT